MTFYHNGRLVRFPRVEVPQGEREFYALLKPMAWILFWDREVDM